mgnify:CR=1 FL=1
MKGNRVYTTIRLGELSFTLTACMAVVGADMR